MRLAHAFIGVDVINVWFLVGIDFCEREDLDGPYIRRVRRLLDDCRRVIGRSTLKITSSF